MKTVCLTVRGCPVEIHQTLLREARHHQRSIRAQAVSWLQEKTQEIQRRPDEQSLLRRIRATRSRVTLSPQEVTAAIEEGRA